MTLDQIHLIKTSWSELISLDDNPGKVFYFHLFESDPGLRKLFKGDMKDQSRKFTSMVTFFAYKLDNWEDVITEATDLGRRHKLYHVPNDSYKLVETALLQTLRESLVESWNDEIEKAWKELYWKLEKLMVPEKQA